MAAEVEEAFFARVSPSDDPLACWNWIGTKSNGYARFRHGAAYRWSYEFFIGPIPSHLEIDHECNNRACVNPWHLDPVTSHVNCQRRIERLPQGQRPKYEVVRNILRDRIASGQTVGRLPNQRDIARQLNVSVPTVCWALRLLHSEGVIDYRRRSGAFVRPHTTIERTYYADERAVETADIVFPGDRYRLIYEMPIDPAQQSQ